MELDDAVLTALDVFGREGDLPTMAWVVLFVNGHVHVEGIADDDVIEAWSRALGLDERDDPTRRQRSWAGELGEWRVRLLAG